MNAVKLNSDYKGKQIFIGIDVHKKTYVITARCENEIVKRVTQLANPKQLAASLLKWFKGAKIAVVYEAGFSGLKLYRTLTNHGITCLVVNPASIEIASNNKVKTDKRDSIKLAEKLEKDEICGNYIPTEQEELNRQYQRVRSQLTASRVRTANQIKGKLHEFGLIDANDDDIMSEKYIKKIRKYKLATELEFCIELLIDQWQHLTKSIRKTELKIREQVANGDRTIQIIKSVPGFGPISTIIMATELIDFMRFRNERVLSSLLGLTPREYSSGEHQRRGKITRQGSNRLRWVLTEAAWRAVRSDEALNTIFLRIAANRGKKKAIVAIARKLAGRIRSCVWNDTLYTINKLA